MAKKHSGNNDLALSYRVDRLPRRMRRDVVLRRMAAFITRGEGLPESWEITLRWQNSPKQPWREDEFQTAISESRQGFVSLVLGRIRRDIAALPEVKRASRKRTKVKRSKKATRRSNRKVRARKNRGKSKTRRQSNRRGSRK
jgi:hypothetical protein